MPRRWLHSVVTMPWSGGVKEEWGVEYAGRPGRQSSQNEAWQKGWSRTCKLVLLWVQRFLLQVKLYFYSFKACIQGAFYMQGQRPAPSFATSWRCMNYTRKGRRRKLGWWEVLGRTLEQLNFNPPWTLILWFWQEASAMAKLLAAEQALSTSLWWSLPQKLKPIKQAREGMWWLRCLRIVEVKTWWFGGVIEHLVYPDFRPKKSNKLRMVKPDMQCHNLYFPTIWMHPSFLHSYLWCWWRDKR